MEKASQDAGIASIKYLIYIIVNNLQLNKEEWIFHYQLTKNVPTVYCDPIFDEFKHNPILTPHLFLRLKNIFEHCTSFPFTWAYFNDL